MKGNSRTASCLLLLAGWLFSFSAAAQGSIEALTGTVRAGASAAAATAASAGQRLTTGTVVVTGAGSSARLRFDDGQVVLLHENATFRVREYNFVQNAPQQDRFVFDLLGGAMRAVTAALTNRNPKAYALQVPQATIGIRGTDFMVALVNPAYVQTLSGSVYSSNVAGVAEFGANTFGTIASETTLGATIPAAQVPAVAMNSFTVLGNMTLVGPLSSAPAAVGGITPAAAAAAGLIGAGIAISSGGGDDGSAATTTTTTTTTAPR